MFVFFTKNELHQLSGQKRTHFKRSCQVDDQAQRSEYFHALAK